MSVRTILLKDYLHFSSRDRDEPLVIRIGVGQVIRGEQRGLHVEGRPPRQRIREAGIWLSIADSFL